MPVLLLRTAVFFIMALLAMMMRSEPSFAGKSIRAEVGATIMQFNKLSEDDILQICLEEESQRCDIAREETKKDQFDEDLWVMRTISREYDVLSTNFE